MAQPWNILDSVTTDQGVLQLRQRGDRDFLITVGTQVLMNSSLHRSEVALGELSCSHLREKPAPRVLVGGLGMAFTLRAVLDNLPVGGEVVVAELNEVVRTWCQGPLAPLTAAAVDDPRVTVEIADIACLIRARSRAKERFDAVVFDLYRGPHAKTDPKGDPLYGSAAIALTRSILQPGGIFAIWGENYDDSFCQRLSAAGFSVSSHRPGHGGLRHAVFIARLTAGSPGIQKRRS